MDEEFRPPDGLTLELLAGFYVLDLATPIPDPLHVGGLLGPPPLTAEAIAQGRKDVAAAEAFKMRALFRHFGIAPPSENAEAWKQLGWALARVHVPGFKIGAPVSHALGVGPWFGSGVERAKRGRGRPRKHAIPGLLAPIAEQHAPTTPKRKPGRPPAMSPAERQQLIDDFDRRIAQARAANPQLASTAAAARHLWGAEAAWMLKGIRRHRRDAESAKNSEKSSEAAANLERFWRST